ncbi:MAG: hypothetical protein ACLFQ8_01190 [Candidatus Aenigmatarchaeota archaeon]
MSPFGLFSSEEKREESVEFEKFEDWLSKEIEESDFEWRNPQNSYSRIERSVEELEQALNEFMAQELPEEIAPRLKNMAESNRKVLISRLQSFIDSFEVPDEEDYITLKNFLEEKSSELDDVSEKIKKSLMVLDKAQPDVTKKVVDSMKGLEKALLVDGELVKATEIIEKIEALKDKVERLSNLQKKKKEIEEELNELLEEREELRQELDELKEKEKTEAIEEKRKKIEQVESRVDNKKDEIRGEVSPLKRGLKKMNYFGLTGDNERLLEGYISSPVEAAEEDEDITFLESIVENLMDKLNEKELDFSEEEASRLRDEVKKMDFGRLNRNLSSLQELRQRKEDLQNSVEELRMDNKKEDLSGSLNRKEEEIESTRERLDKQKNEISSMEETVNELKQEIENSVEDLLKIDLNLKGIEP